jgi:hypothetical protein
MALWFAVAMGRGSALTAHVRGPYNSVAAEAAANPGIAGETVTVVGNKAGYPTQGAAQKAVNTYNAGSVTSRVTQAGGNTAQSLGVDPTQLFHGLNLGGLILRIGEVILGVVLIGVGMAKLTGTDNFIMKAATTAGKAALL